MDFDQVMRMLKGKSEVKLVKFVSDKGPNSREKCLAFHGRVFRADDPEKPELPIHQSSPWEIKSQPAQLSFWPSSKGRSTPIP